MIKLIFRSYAFLLFKIEKSQKNNLGRLKMNLQVKIRAVRDVRVSVFTLSIGGVAESKTALDFQNYFRRIPHREYLLSCNWVVGHLKLCLNEGTCDNAKTNGNDMLVTFSR
jgi:hypothetical protein